MSKKYVLTDDTIMYSCRTLHRIKALRSFSDVTVGDLGGWIESEKNLSQKGDAWIYDDANICGNALVCGDAKVCGNAEVCGNADYIVFKNFWSSGCYFTWTRSNNMWRVGCFYGTGEELIKKAYSDSEKSGREYERVVRYVESILADEKKM